MTQASTHLSERNKRIHAGAIDTRHTLFAAMDEAINLPERTRTGLITAMVGARNAMPIEATAGLPIACLFGWAVRQRSIFLRAVRSVGVVAVLCALPTADRLWPAPFAAVLSHDALTSVRSVLQEQTDLIGVTLKL